MVRQRCPTTCPTGLWDTDAETFSQLSFGAACPAVCGALSWRHIVTHTHVA